MPALEPLQAALGDVLLPAVLGLLGLAALAGAAKNYRKHRAVASAVPTDVGALSPGPVVVSGTVVPTDDVLARPFTDGQCVAGAFEVESHMARRRGRAWQQVDRGTMQVPFRVDDGTGEVLVADGAELVLEHVEEETVEVGGDEPLPPAVERFAEARSVAGGGHLFDAEETRTDDRRYVQRVLAAGDEVTVVGRAVDLQETASGASGETRPASRAARDPDAPPGARGVLLRAREGGTFIVTDAAPERLGSHLGGWRWRLVAGAVLLVACGWLLVPVLSS